MSAATEYDAIANALVTRILETLKLHPEAADVTDAWALFKVPGFKCDDLAPSFAQASWALSRARRLFREQP